ncbi:MAG TPA: glycine oxidase ThiO [Pyrinomonadaceae bacterium]|nr:glycine oxidase ThiO [Pyrinomonadaceae bacterium]
MKDNLTNFDAIIVGGGVIGLSIARSLALRGVREICVIERQVCGTEASYAAAGMLAPQAEADTQDGFFQLLCRSRDLYSDWASSLKAETGIDIELDLTGTLCLSFTEDEQRELDHRFDWQSKAGLSAERLTAAEALTLEPQISPAITGALLFPRDVQVENRRLLAALANSVQGFGISVLNETNVDEVVASAGRVSGVRTNKGLIQSSTVIVAAGAWSDLNGAMKFPVEPVRGQMVCLSAKPQLTRHVIYSPRGYLVPRQDGRLIAGSTTEHVGYLKLVTAGGLKSILLNAGEISPAIERLPVVTSWAGLRPRAPDGLPLLGPCDEIEGLIYATGHYRNGILLAPLTGELIADTVVDGRISGELATFSPNRFRFASVN